MVVDPDKTVEAAEPPTQPLEDLVARQAGEKPVRTGIGMTVDRLHRHVQKQLVTAAPRRGGLLSEVARIGHERHGQRTAQSNRFGGAGPIEAEIVEYDRNERPVARWRRRYRVAQPSRLSSNRWREARRRPQGRFLGRLTRLRWLFGGSDDYRGRPSDALPWRSLVVPIGQHAQHNSGAEDHHHEKDGDAGAFGYVSPKTAHDRAPPLPNQPGGPTSHCLTPLAARCCTRIDANHPPSRPPGTQGLERKLRASAKSAAEAPRSRRAGDALSVNWAGSRVPGPCPRSSV